MKKYPAINKIEIVLNDLEKQVSRAEVVGLAILLVSPLMLSIIVNGGLSVFSGFAIISNVVLDRYFCKGLMTAGYMLQNRGKVVGSIPLVLEVISQAIKQIVRVRLGFSLNLFQGLKTAVEESMIENKKYIIAFGIEVCRRVQIGLFREQLVDDFFWRTNSKEQYVTASI